MVSVISNLDFQFNLSSSNTESVVYVLCLTLVFKVVHFEPSVPTYHVAEVHSAAGFTTQPRQPTYHQVHPGYWPTNATRLLKAGTKV